MILLLLSTKDSLIGMNGTSFALVLNPYLTLRRKTTTKKVRPNRIKNEVPSTRARQPHEKHGYKKGNEIRRKHRRKAQLRRE